MEEVPLVIIHAFSFIKEYPIIITCFSLFIAICSFTFAFLNFRRKSSIKLRSLFTISSIITSTNKYISQVTIENSKDRSVSIFAIYLHIKPNIYIELSNYENQPLIIKAYDTITINYQPVFFYAANEYRIDINKALNNKKNKIRIVVATSGGKYEIKDRINYWIPYFDIIKNHYTQWVVPVTLTHEGKNIGSNIDYILYINYQNHESIYQVHHYEPNLLIPKEYELTPDVTESKDKLEQHLNRLIQENKITCSSYKIIETKNLIESPSKTITIDSVSWFRYKIIGALFTKILNLTKTWCGTAKRPHK